MNKEYHVKREQAIEDEKRRIIEDDQRFRAATTDEERAKLDARRFLQAKFGLETVMFVVLHDLHFLVCNQIEAAARQLGLFRESTWRRGKTLVIATTEDIAVRERDRIELERKEEKEAREQEKWNTLNKKRLQLKSVEGHDASPTGQWALHMPKLYDNNDWEHADGECNIYLPKYDPAYEYAYAKFKFVNFKGYFKIHLMKDTWLGVELKVDWEGRDVVDDLGEYDLEHRNVATITFTSTSECCGYIDGWFGAMEFKGVKVSHEADATVEKCRMKFEREKKWWDEERADHYGDSDRSGNEEYSEADESMDEVKIEVKEEEGESMNEVRLTETEDILPVVKKEEE